MTKAEGKLIVEQKVDDFSKNEKELLSKSFQETEARNRFIDPFFEALGWDFKQTNISKKYWDVHREFSQKDNSSTKKPDYAFRIKEGNNYKEKFFVEAKAPNVLLTDKAPVFQAKRYSFSSHGKTPIVILTDFQEFRVFNGLQRPVFNNPLQGLVKDFDFKYTDYIDKWNLLFDTFSKDAVKEGSIHKLVGKVAKKTKTLDEEFLLDIMCWREILAKHIANRNSSLSDDELNEAVQRILDRLIFIRNLEDRNIEPENMLYNLSRTKGNIYETIIPVFNRLDGEYNGLLFKKHFSEELIIDDSVIKDVIESMCYPQSPFQFDIIEPEIIGRIYEKFLGSKIRLTENHHAKVEEKPEVRHAGGVYYTPQFIVDYIVENTVGENIKAKSPDEIKLIKVLDPACGSGSFLLGAFDYLIKYHERWYEGKKASKKYKDDFEVTPDGDIKLTVKKKADILRNNLFGVDIDREATEVATMSLYLKLLDEGFDKGQGEIFIRDTILPDMTGNIKCGNSLISREQLFSNNLFGDEDIKPFDWKTEYASIFNNGGFDCVIGNPPYIRIQELQSWAPKAVEVYKNIYKSGGKGNFDIYVLFIEQSINLINENGNIGFILPHKFFNASYGENVRNILSKEKYVSKVVHFGDIQIFEGATTYTCLLFLSKNPTDAISISKIKFLDLWRNEKKADVGTISASSLSSKEWSFQIGSNSGIFKNLEQFPIKLLDVCDRIFQGLVTSADPVYLLEPIETKLKGYVKVFSKATEKEYLLETGVTHPLCKGSLDVRRYDCRASKYVIFPYDIEKSILENKSTLISEKDFGLKFPNTWEYLKENQNYLQNRENGKMKHSGWYGYVYPKSITLFASKKILTPSIASNASYYLDGIGEYYFVGSGGGGGGGYGITLKTNVSVSYEYILGLLNSKLLDSYLKSYSSPFRGGYFAYNRQYIEKLPIYIPEPIDKIKYENCKKVEEYVKQIIELKIHDKDKDAEFLESKIDGLVYKLYDLTDEEIKIVENAPK